VCQHIEYMLETFLFTTFVPDTHRMTVMNHFGLQKDVEFLLHHLVHKNLYGAYLVEVRDKKRLRKQLVGFADKILKGADPEVFCIWASGETWNPKMKNGIRSFKPGTFYMSAFTQTPICIIHSRISKDGKRVVVEQSDLIYPPLPETLKQTPDYMSFYEDDLNKENVEKYCRRVEDVYRRMDDGLFREINLENYNPV